MAATAIGHSSVQTGRFSTGEDATVLMASPTKVVVDAQLDDALDATTDEAVQQKHHTQHQHQHQHQYTDARPSVPSTFAAAAVPTHRSFSSSSSGADSFLSSGGSSSLSASTRSTTATSEDVMENEVEEYSSSSSSENDDEKSSSGHTVTRVTSVVEEVEEPLSTRRPSLVDASGSLNKPSSATPSSHSPQSHHYQLEHRDRYYLSQLPVVVANNSSSSSSQQHQHDTARRGGIRASVARHNTLATIPAARESTTSTTTSRHRSFGAHTSTSGNNRAHSTSPRHTLSRSYTTSAVSTMAIAPVSLGGGNSPPQAFLPTSSVAPPVHNSASVTFAPAPQSFTSSASSSRPRSHSTSATTSTSSISSSSSMSPTTSSSGSTMPPQSPAMATMASLTASEAFSPRSTTQSPSSPPPPPDSAGGAGGGGGGGNNAVLMHWKSSSNGHTSSTSPDSPPAFRSTASAAAYHQFQQHFQTTNNNNNNTSSSPPPNSAPYHISPATLRRHSVDPYGTSGNIFSPATTAPAGTNNSSITNNQASTVLQAGSAGQAASTSALSTAATATTTTTTLASATVNQRRHHQSVSIPANEYSSLGDHINHLNSRYRKVSLGSQTLLSPSTGDLMPSAPGSSVNSILSPGSSLERRPWDPAVTHHNSHAHHSHSRSAAFQGSPDNKGPAQLSPTRSRTDPYLATSPRYSSRSSHDNQRSNHLEAKIVLLGRQGVGKTSLVHRYMTGQFSSSLPMTIGASFLTKKLDFEGGIKVRLQIWDTAGQERFRSMAPMYYRGAHAAILVYDITNEDSLADIQVWLDELRRNMSSDLIVHIVGNKADLAHSSRKIQLADAKTQIAQWIAQPMQGMESSTLAVPSGRRSTSGGTSSPSRTGEDCSSSSNPTAGAAGSSRSGMTGLASFSLSRSGSRQKAIEEQEPAAPAFKDWGVEEVSAKEDEGIDMLFATIAGKLVERKSQIEHERVLRTKDSIMITDEMKGKAADSTRVWGCC